MKSVVLLLTLATGLAMASSSFGQSVNMMPSQAYDAQGYADESPVARRSDDGARADRGSRSRTQRLRCRIAC
jgi:hypothetical protein